VSQLGRWSTLTTALSTGYRTDSVDSDASTVSLCTARPAPQVRTGDKQSVPCIVLYDKLCALIAIAFTVCHRSLVSLTAYAACCTTAGDEEDRDLSRDACCLCWE
jgi:hypothetical protein